MEDIFCPHLRCGKRTSNSSKWQLWDTIPIHSWASRETLPGLSCRRHMTPREPCRCMNCLLHLDFPLHCFCFEQTVLYIEASVITGSVFNMERAELQVISAFCINHRSPPQSPPSNVGQGYLPERRIWTGPKWRRKAPSNSSHNGSGMAKE